MLLARHPHARREGIPGDERATYCGVVTVAAEALLAEEVGQTGREPIEDGAGALGGELGLAVDLAKGDCEPIPAQMAGAQLVGVAGRRQHGHARDGDGERGFRGDRWRQGTELASDGVTILETSCADVLGADIEAAGQRPTHVHGREATLLDQGEDVVTAALGLVGGNLLDYEVVDAVAKDPSAAG